SKCKCTATDSGVFKWGPKQIQVTYDPKKEYDIPDCKSYLEHPGLCNNPGEPPFQPFPNGVHWNGQTDHYHFNYAMTISVSCEDSEGAIMRDSAPVNGDYQFGVV